MHSYVNTELNILLNEILFCFYFKFGYGSIAQLDVNISAKSVPYGKNIITY